MIYVDHQMLGKAPLDVLVPPGEHEVRVSLDDRFIPFVQTVQVAVGEVRAVEVVLQMTSPALYDAAMKAFVAGETAQAEALLSRATQAPGKKAAEIPFYLGLLAERRGDLPAAEKHLVAYLGVKDSSPVAHFRLGAIRQLLGQDALAATGYKNALLRMVSGASAIMACAGGPTFDNIARLQREAESTSPSRLATRMQLAWLCEQKGAIVEARDLYRKVFAEVVERGHLDTSVPFPAGLPYTIPTRETIGAPAAEPSNTLYVTADNTGSVAAAWKKWVAAHPTMAGKALISVPTRRWVALQAQAFDRQDHEAMTAACAGLSLSLQTQVVCLVVSRDGRAWYFYYDRGRQMDRYCSNPGRPGEVDYRTLRSWSGRPDVLVAACRGVPLSSYGGPQVTITDLNSVIYFYYPEMRTTRPASYRTPGAFMKVLGRLLGIGHPPSRYARYPTGDDWKGFRPL